MSNFKQRLDKLEKFTGKGEYSHVRLVFSDEEAAAVYSVLGKGVHIIQICPLTSGGKECHA
ncbi:MAG: hypothetical protein PHN84_15835 [Desulfuromonadaceae bacterium]|nr:hypothetical protein [Desulfuromonadaceae bacterium]MDD2856606.1 hypothetical protein [Desulfuromonadaceae bacterium]